MTSAGWYVARRKWRGQRSAAVTLAVVVAVVVAAVLACASAARRSHTALDRLRAEAHASDESLFVNDLELAERVADLPQLEDATVLHLLWVTPAASGPEDFFPVVVDPDGRFLYDVDRFEVVDGALPPTDDPDAIVLTEDTAELLGVRAGDALAMKSLSPREAEQVMTGDLDAPAWRGPRPVLEVAAVVRVPPITDDPAGTALSVVTPGFLDHGGEQVPTFGALVQMRLGPGVTQAELTEAIDALPGGETVGQDAAGTGGIAAASAALDTVALGLALLAAAAALAGVVIGGQAAARLVTAAGDDVPALTAVGLSPSDQVLALTLAPLVAVGLGVLGGAVAAPFVASHLGGDLARRIDPGRGHPVDAVVMTLGAGLIAAALIGLILLVAARTRDSAERRRARARRPLPATIAGRAGLSSPAVAGLALAGSPGGRRAPMGQAVASAAVAVTGLVAVTVFGTSLGRTLDEPRQYGWGWQASVGGALEDDGDLDRHHVTDAAEISWGLIARLDGEPLPAMSVEPVRGHIEPVLVRGRPIERPDEVLVGEKTLDDLDRGLGDAARLEGPGGEREVRVVGTTTFAAPHDPLPVARGVVVAPALVEELGLDQQGYRNLAVDVAGDPHVQLADLDDVTFPEPPIEVSRLDEVRGYPWALAVFLALLAAFGIGQLTIVLARRRRRDLSTLRAMGFTRRQVGRALLTQTAVVLVIAVVIGVPVGLVVGRLGWLSVTSALGLPFRPDVAATGLVVLVLAIVVVAVAATVPGTIAAARLRVAPALREE